MNVGGYLVHTCGDIRKVIKVENGYVYTESHGMVGVMPLKFYFTSRHWNYVNNIDFGDGD